MRGTLDAAGGDAQRAVGAGASTVCPAGNRGSAEASGAPIERRTRASAPKTKAASATTWNVRSRLMRWRSGRCVGRSVAASAAGSWGAGWITGAGAYRGGRPVQAEIMAEAARLAQAAAQPIDDVRGTADFRRHLSAVLMRRALERAVERARA